jgi:hypothetical protein
MKVHNFQIEVMWLFLAVSLCDVAIREKTGFTNRTIKLKGIQKETYFPIQIRPPP